MVRKSYSLIAGLLLCAGLSAQTMSGTYSIPGTYKTFTAAAAALQKNGVNGPVTFMVIPGVYTESFTLPHVPGASSTNTVTFKSIVPGQAKLKGVQGPTVTFALGTSTQLINWYVLDGFEFTSGPDNAILGNQYNYDIEIKNCTFTANHGTGQTSTSLKRLIYLKGYKIERWNIHHNEFTLIPGSGVRSMYFSQIMYCKFHHNTVHLNGCYYGFYLINSNNSQNHYYNNIFEGKLFNSSGSVVFYIGASQYDINLSHNTFMVDTGTSGARIIYGRGCCTTRRVWVYSNIFYNLGSGPCIDFYTGASYLTNYYRGDGNVFYRPGTTPVVVGRVGATNYNLAGWQAATSSQDKGSKVGRPYFINATTAPYDFRILPISPAKDNAVAFPGQPTFPVFPITDDFVGNPRGAKPDSGAYEFSNVILFGNACAGSGNYAPVIGYSGTAGIGGSNFAVTLSKALGNQAALMIFGTSNSSWGPLTLPFSIGGGCSLNVRITMALALPVTGSGPGNGTATQPMPIPNDPALAGGLFYLQWLASDPQAPSNYGLTATQGASVRL